MSPFASLLRGAIRVYQWTLGPALGVNCRFCPTCSEYARQAIGEHGALHGTWLSLRRVVRCNPWHAGGDDPVPPRSIADRVRGRSTATAE